MRKSSNQRAFFHAPFVPVGVNAKKGMVIFMITVGERIAELRKRKSMTQEELAAIIGVSAQSVSKWENNTNMPDIMLLPVIADTFGVTVDTLYGRNRASYNGISSDTVLNDVCHSVCQTILSACGDADNFKEPFSERLNNYIEALRKDGRMRSAVIRPHGVVYFRDGIGGLALKRPEKGWRSLLSDDGAEDILKLLADGDFRLALQNVIKNNMKSFTLPSLCSMCRISDSDKLEGNLKKSNLFSFKKIIVDGKDVTIYEPFETQKLFLLFAVLTYAREYADYEEIYMNYFGDSNFCRED